MVVKYTIMKNFWNSDDNIISKVLSRRLESCGCQIYKIKTFETVMIMSFSEVLSRRLESINSEKITQQVDKLKYSII